MKAFYYLQSVNAIVFVLKCRFYRLQYLLLLNHCCLRSVSKFLLFSTFFLYRDFSLPYFRGVLVRSPFLMGLKMKKLSGPQKNLLTQVFAAYIYIYWGEGRWFFFIAPRPNKKKNCWNERGGNKEWMGCERDLNIFPHQLLEKIN